MLWDGMGGGVRCGELVREQGVGTLLKAPCTLFFFSFRLQSALLSCSFLTLIVALAVAFVGAKKKKKRALLSRFFLLLLLRV